MGNETSCEEATQENIKFIKAKLIVSNYFITAENVNQLLSESLVPNDTEVLSLDLDLNTYHIWEKQMLSNPKSLIEYNGFFPVQSDWITITKIRALEWGNQYGWIAEIPSHFIRKKDIV